MNVGVLKEIKNNENRVGLTPAGTRELVAHGHVVYVQTGAGAGSGFADEEYVSAGAFMVTEPEKICDAVDILVKVKEPVPVEYPLLQRLRGKTLFTYLHLSGVDPQLTRELLDNHVTAIAYETVEDENGRLPLLAPMSEIAGVLAVQYGAQYLQKKYGGRGLTLGPITNTDSSLTVVVGGGFVGEKAAKCAAGMGGRVAIFDVRPERVEQLKKNFLEYLGPVLASHVEALVSEPAILASKIAEADLVVGAVLVPGARAPKVVTEEHVKSMKQGSVIVDVSIDQGGCVWGSHATTHEDPIYKIGDVIFCCVANMPGQVARQSTQALTGATLPYLLKMADDGVVESVQWSLAHNGGRFARGLNVHAGKLTYRAVAEDLGLAGEYEEVGEVVSK
jgi:alanine dehydrogenase